MEQNCQCIPEHFFKKDYGPTKKELGVKAVKEDFSLFISRYISKPTSYRFERDYLCRINTILFELVRPRRCPMSERMLKKHIKSLKQAYQNYCEETL